MILVIILIGLPVAWVIGYAVVELIKFKKIMKHWNPFYFLDRK